MRKEVRIYPSPHFYNCCFRTSCVITAKLVHLSNLVKRNNSQNRHWFTVTFNIKLVNLCLASNCIPELDTTDAIFVHFMHHSGVQCHEEKLCLQRFSVRFRKITDVKTTPIGKHGILLSISFPPVFLYSAEGNHDRKVDICEAGLTV